MHRFASIALIAGFALLGTGAAEYLHNLDHAQRDRIAAAAAREAGKTAPLEKHDDSTCALHAQLHLPLMSNGWAPLLVCLGVFVAFLSLLWAPLVSQRTLSRVDCRGPPAC